MRKIRVLHIITRLCKGGALEVVLKIISGLNKEKYDVTLLCGSEDLVEISEEIPGLKICIMPQLIRRIDPFKDSIAFIKLYLFMKRERFDIVHTHTSKAGILGRFAAKLSGVPVIFHMPHGSIFHPIYFGKTAIFILSRIEKIAAFCTDKIIIGSDNEREDLLSHGIGSDDKYAIILHCFVKEGFSDTNIDKRAKREELNIPEDVFLLANIARLVPEKGHIFCLEAFRRVVDEAPDTMLMIVGDGPMRSALERKITELNLGGNVRLTGFREDIPGILSVADILLQTSLWEGTPLSIAEAMASGKAVVATAVGGIPEMINDGVNGILVQSQDADELAKCIIRLTRDKELLAGLGREAKEYARAKFNSKYVIDEINNLYDSFLKGKASGDVS